MNEWNQVCVWPGIVVGSDRVGEFVSGMQEMFGARVKYIEEVKTNPDPGVPETGGRNDLLFYIHDDDIAKFAIPRLTAGIRWLEDVHGNGDVHLYPDRIWELRTW